MSIIVKRNEPAKPLVLRSIKLLMPFICSVWAFFSTTSYAELAVVVNIDSPANAISVEELTSLFLGKTRYLADGTKVVPLDQLEGTASRVEFYKKVVQKSESQLNSYWSRLIFAGKGRPPYSVADDAEVLEFILANRNMIGYVDVESVSAQVKVILVIP